MSNTKSLKNFSKSLSKLPALLHNYFHYIFGIVGISLVAILFSFNSLFVQFAFDESAHLARALNVSEGNLFETDPYNMLPIGLAMQFSPVVLDKDAFPTLPDKTLDLYQNDQTLGSVPLNDLSYGSLLMGTDPTNNYSFILYIPAAIGLKVASLLNLTSFDAFQTARIFNLLAYIVSIFFILKFFRRFNFKYFLAVIAIIPTCLGGGTRYFC